MGRIRGLKAIAIGIALLYVLGYLYGFNLSYLFYDIAGLLVPTIMIWYGIVSIVGGRKKGNVPTTIRSETSKNQIEQGNTPPTRQKNIFGDKGNLKIDYNYNSQND